MAELDDTHDPALTSWVASANGATPFPIQNLPYCVWRPRWGGAWRTGVGIGDHVLDLAAVQDSELIEGEAAAALAVAQGDRLNGLMALDRSQWRALRRGLSRLLSAASTARQGLLMPQADAEFALPAQVGDFTDFYASLPHVLNGSRVNRPGDAFPPSFKWMPLGYHGRSSSIVVSGTPVVRPWGQVMPAGAEAPVYAPTAMLDYEAELGFYAGRGNALGAPIPIEQAHEHIFGCTLLNDWSARDVQTWEMKPVGPLLGKDFATTVSPWIVTMEALAPFRVAPAPREAGDPQPLPHLDCVFERQSGGLDIVIEAHLKTPGMPAPQRIGRGDYRGHYWTIGQMFAHHTSNGLNLRPGDILATGTISSHGEGGGGCLLELAQRGAAPINVGGEQRGFLADGDELSLTAWCQREGFAAIGFGWASGVVQPAAG